MKHCAFFFFFFWGGGAWGREGAGVSDFFTKNPNLNFLGGRGGGREFVNFFTTIPNLKKKLLRWYGGWGG